MTRPLHILLLLALLAGGAGCGTTELPLRNSADRPHKAFVEKSKKLSVVNRGKSYNVKAKEMIPYPRMVVNRPESLCTLVDEILLQGDYNGLEELEKRLESRDVRCVVWEAVIAMDPNKERNCVLKKWSMIYIEEPMLLRFHPKGKKLLLEILNDKNVSYSRRAQCAYNLALTGDKDVLPYLERYANDDTELKLKGAWNPTTFGAMIRQSIQAFEFTITQRNKDSQESNLKHTK